MRAQLAAAAQLLASPPLLAAAFDAGRTASDAGAKCENALLQVRPFCEQHALARAFRRTVAEVSGPPVQHLFAVFRQCLHAAGQVHPVSTAPQVTADYQASGMATLPACR